MDYNQMYKILKEFKECPTKVLENEKKKEKLFAAINKSIKLLHKEKSKSENKQDWRYL